MVCDAGLWVQSLTLLGARRADSGVGFGGFWGFSSSLGQFGAQGCDAIAQNYRFSNTQTSSIACNPAFLEELLDREPKKETVRRKQGAKPQAPKR